MELPVFYDLFSVPVWVMSDILINVSVTVIDHTELVTKHFILITVFIVVTGARVLNTNLQSAERQSVVSKVTSVSLRFLELKSVVKRINKTFGTLILVNTVADMVAVVSLLAFALRTQLEQEEDESNWSFQFQQTLAATEASNTYERRGLYLANAILRLLVFLAWNIQVRA